MTELNLCLPEAYHTRPRRLIFELRVTDKNQFKKSALLLRVGCTGERAQLEKSPFPVNPPTLSYPASYYASIGLLSKGIEKL